MMRIGCVRDEKLKGWVISIDDADLLSVIFADGV